MAEDQIITTEQSVDEAAPETATADVSAKIKSSKKKKSKSK